MLFDRSIRQELAHVAGACFVTLLTIVITTALVRVLGDAANGRLGEENVLLMILFGTLRYLSVILILTCFLSVLIVVSRACRDREMTVWWSSGVSLSRWIKPVLHFSIPMTILALLASSILTPWAKQRSDVVRKQFEQRSDISKASAGQFRESSDGSRVFFIEKDTVDHSNIENIFVVQRGKSIQQPLSLIMASKGSIESSVIGERYLVLQQGQRYDVEKRTDYFSALEFFRYGVRLEPGIFLPPNTSLQSTDTLSLVDDHQPAARGELLWRLGLPLSGLALSMLAIPMAFFNARAGRSLNLIFAILIYLLYSNSLSIMQAWVTQEKISFMTGICLPHAAVLSLFLLLLWLRSNTARPSFVKHLQRRLSNNVQARSS